ncbi:MAG TPA: type I DNA topoisomerase [Chloroflexota bacterium]|jgi:DNA topoisomerase-1|nr:type I DNA topoisomerase [Chloroflexota bacterium]
MQLVIVESPKKARTIEKILGHGFRVEASYGHVRDLPPKGLGVAIEDGFRPDWVPVPRAKTRLAALRKAAAGAERVVLATDPDREGEAIAWHVADALRLRAPTRVVFHAITANAVKAAFEQPRALDQRLVQAQQARRVLDRLVGYQVSPLLWRKIAKGTSAGRVQSVALRLVVEREREIRAFVPREYWTIDARLCPTDRPDEQFVARLIKIGRDDAQIPDRAAAEPIVADLQRATYRVAAQATRSVERAPPPPFTTSTLQQAAASRLRLAGKRTMQLAQSLYEAGLITYHRTDAVRVEPEAIEAARALIAERFGRDYLPDRPRQYANRVKNAQEAHEAIRPADPARRPEALPGSTAADERALYRLIWQRFVASQMSSARYSRRTVDVEARAEGSYLLRAGATTLVFPGYLAVYGAEPGEGGIDQDEAEAANDRLPALRDGEALRLLGLDPRQHFTKPPPRFNEPSLVKELERAGVGRPSTYATIVATLDERGYVEREKGFFVPTELGLAVNDFVVSFFPTVADVGFTAQLEDGLDAVARGEQGWQALLSDFYRPFRSALDVAGRAAATLVERERTAAPPARTPGTPPSRRVRRRAPQPDPLTRRTVARGERRPAPGEDARERPAGELCPLCGRPMVERKGPYSTFLGCSGFPQCRGTVKLETRASARPGKSRSRRRSRGR